MNRLTQFLSIATLVLTVGVAGSPFGIAQTKTTETETTESSSSSEGGRTTTTTTTTRIAKSEDITPRENMILVDPVKFFTLYNMSYYRAVSPTVVVGGGIQSPTGLVDATGIGVIGDVAYYPTGKVFRGFHFGGGISYNNLTSTRSTYSYDPTIQDYTYVTTKETVAPIAINATIGWHWYPWDEFATEIGLGADLVTNGYPKEAGDRGSSFIGMEDNIPFVAVRNGIWPSLRFRIGYAW